MDATDKAEMRQMMEDILSAHNKEIKGRLNVMQAHLVHIKEQTTRTNGRVTALEEAVDALHEADTKHTITCPNIPRIVALENAELSRKTITKFIAGVSVATGAIVGAVVAIIEFIIK